MSEYPRVEPKSAEGPFFLDRIAAWAVIVYAAVGFAITVWSLQRGYVRTQDMGSVGWWGYLARRWWVHLRYLTTLAMYGWACLGMIRGRRWSFPLLALLELSDLPYYLHYFYPYGLVGSGLGSAYALVRLIGWLGPRTGDRFDLGEAGSR